MALLGVAGGSSGGGRRAGRWDQARGAGRAAVGPEREHLWQRFRELDQNLDAYAARRGHETAFVVLEPGVVTG